MYNKDILTKYLIHIISIRYIYDESTFMYVTAFVEIVVIMFLMKFINVAEEKIYGSGYKF